MSIHMPANQEIEEYEAGQREPILSYLRLARAATLQDPAKSRELSLVLTKIDEAVLWRQQDLQLKTPSADEGGASR